MFVMYRQILLAYLFVLINLIMNILLFDTPFHKSFPAVPWLLSRCKKILREPNEMIKLSRTHLVIKFVCHMKEMMSDWVIHHVREHNIFNYRGFCHCSYDVMQVCKLYCVCTCVMSPHMMFHRSVRQGFGILNDDKLIISVGSFVNSLEFCRITSPVVKQHPSTSARYRRIVTHDVVIMTGHNNGRIRAWDVKTGELGCLLCFVCY